MSVTKKPISNTSSKMAKQQTSDAEFQKHLKILDDNKLTFPVKISDYFGKNYKPKPETVWDDISILTLFCQVLEITLFRKLKSRLCFLIFDTGGSDLYDIVIDQKLSDSSRLNPFTCSVSPPITDIIKRFTSKGDIASFISSISETFHEFGITLTPNEVSNIVLTWKPEHIGRIIALRFKETFSKGQEITKKRLLKDFQWMKTMYPGICPLTSDNYSLCDKDDKCPLHNKEIAFVESIKDNIVKSVTSGKRKSTRINKKQPIKGKLAKTTNRSKISNVEHATSDTQSYTEDSDVQSCNENEENQTIIENPCTSSQSKLFGKGVKEDGTSKTGYKETTQDIQMESLTISESDDSDNREDHKETTSNKCKKFEWKKLPNVIGVALDYKPEKVEDLYHLFLSTKKGEECSDKRQLGIEFTEYCNNYALKCVNSTGIYDETILRSKAAIDIFEQRINMLMTQVSEVINQHGNVPDKLDLLITQVNSMKQKIIDYPNRAPIRMNELHHIPPLSSQEAPAPSPSPEPVSRQLSGPPQAVGIPSSYIEALKRRKSQKPQPMQGVEINDT